MDSIFEISELIALDISGQLTQQEKKRLEKWLNSSEKNPQLYLRIKDERNLSARNLEYELVDVEIGWNNFSNKIEREPKRMLIPLLYKYAAAILLPLLIGISIYWLINEKHQINVQPLVSIMPGTSHAVLILADGKKIDLTSDSTRNLIEHNGTVIQNSKKELSYGQQVSTNSNIPPLNSLMVPRGGEYTVILSDGTRVYVNSMSKLVYPVTFTGRKREITLEGEAYFEVAKDKSKPFIVSIRGLKVEVLGTSFNIKAYPDEIQSFTTLVEGKVKIDSGIKSSERHFLEPDQQAVYSSSSKEILIQKVDSKKVAQWISGKYYFTNQTLEEIVRTLSRWYDFNYKFGDDSIKKIRFEGGLNKYESIGPILEIINKTGKVRVSINGKEIVFSKI